MVSFVKSDFVIFYCDIHVMYIQFSASIIFKDRIFFSLNWFVASIFCSITSRRDDATAKVGRAHVLWLGIH